MTGYDPDLAEALNAPDLDTMIDRKIDVWVAVR